MSLQYVIDGYNIIHHPRFAQLSPKGSSPQASLIALIRQANLCGSKNNSVTIVFDGYSPAEYRESHFVSLRGGRRPTKQSKNKIASAPAVPRNDTGRQFFDTLPGIMEGSEIRVIFSQDEEADARINRIVQSQANPKTLVIVSDDKQIRIFAKAYGASALGTDEFLSRSEKLKFKDKDKDEAKLNYSQMQKVNDELRKIWLK